MIFVLKNADSSVVLSGTEMTVVAMIFLGPHPINTMDS